MVGSLLILLLSAHGELYLEITPCPGVSTKEVQRLVPIELDVSLADAPNVGVPWASIRCEGTKAILTYDRAQRTIDLAKIDPRARPRLLALALAELASPPPPPPHAEETPAIVIPLPPPDLRPPPPSSIEPPPRIEPPPPEIAPPPPPPPKVEPPPPVTVHAAATSTPAPTSLHLAASVMGGAQLFTAGGPPTFGGRAAVEIAPSAFGARLDLGAHFGSEHVELGDVSLLAVAAGLSGFGRFEGGSIVAFDVGAGARVGFARIDGSPSNPASTEGSTVSGTWAGPFLQLRATFRFAPLLVTAEVEGGLVIRPVVGNAEGTAVAAADGAWFGFHLGVGLEP